MNLYNAVYNMCILKVFLYFLGTCFTASQCQLVYGYIPLIINFLSL